MDIVATCRVASYDLFFKVGCYFIIMMKINVTINFNILMFLFFCAKLNVMEMKIIVFLYHKHGKISYVERKSISAS